MTLLFPKRIYAISVSLFNNKSITPDQSQFAKALGSAWFLFENLTTSISHVYGNTTPEWKYYGPKSGWVLKTMLKKKNLFFVIPCNGYFKVAITLGQKAFDALLQGDLPDAVKEQWKEATNHTEGRTVHFDVKKEADSLLVFRLIDVKMRSS